MQDMTILRVVNSLAQRDWTQIPHLTEIFATHGTRSILSVFTVHDLGEVSMLVRVEISECLQLMNMCIVLRSTLFRLDTWCFFIDHFSCEKSGRDLQCMVILDGLTNSNVLVIESSNVDELPLLVLSLFSENTSSLTHANDSLSIDNIELGVGRTSALIYLRLIARQRTVLFCT